MIPQGIRFTQIEKTPGRLLTVRVFFTIHITGNAEAEHRRSYSDVINR